MQKPTRTRKKNLTKPSLQATSKALTGIIAAGVCLVLFTMVAAAGKTDGGFAVLSVILILAPVIGIVALINLFAIPLQSRKNNLSKRRSLSDTSVSGGSLFRLFSWAISAIIVIFIVYSIVIPWASYTFSK